MLKGWDRLRYPVQRLADGLLQWPWRNWTPAGRFLLSVLTGAAVFGLDTNQSLDHQLFCFLSALVVASRLASRRLRPRFSAVRALPRNATVGRPMSYSIKVTNRSPHPCDGAQIAEDFPRARPSREEFSSQAGPPEADWVARYSGFARWRALGAKARPAMAPAPVPRLEPGETAAVACSLTPSRRGRLELKSLRLQLAEPLGLSWAAETSGETQSVLILPRRHPVPRLTPPGTRRYQPGGVAGSSSVGDSHEFMSLRDYRPGDPMRRIHWRSWAKAGKPVVREDQDEFFTRHALILDTFTGPEPGEAFEEAVSAAASFLSSVLTQESLVDLLFLGDKAYSFTAGRGLGSEAALLEVLAGVRPRTDGSFEELRRTVLSGSRAMSAALVVLLAWDDPRRKFIKDLRAAGVPVLALVVETPPPGEITLTGARRLLPGRLAEGLAAVPPGPEAWS